MGDWREIAIARSDRTRPRENPHRVTIPVEYGAVLANMVDIAAKERGMSRAGYIRRAVAAFVSADTDMPLEQLLAHCAPPDRRNRHARLEDGSLPPTEDDGKGYGKWKASGFKKGTSLWEND